MPDSVKTYHLPQIQLKTISMAPLRASFMKILSSQRKVQEPEMESLLQPKESSSGLT